MTQLHVVKPDGTPLCPEAEQRAAMNDDEFWAHVYGQDSPDEELPEEILEATTQFDPCPECGEIGPCAVDDLGRPMVHLLPREEDQ